jgi:hypothetical protein
MYEMLAFTIILIILDAGFFLFFDEHNEETCIVLILFTVLCLLFLVLSWVASSRVYRFKATAKGITPPWGPSPYRFSDKPPFVRYNAIEKMLIYERKGRLRAFLYHGTMGFKVETLSFVSIGEKAMVGFLVHVRGRDELRRKVTVMVWDVKAKCYRPGKLDDLSL